MSDLLAYVFLALCVYTFIEFVQWITRRPLNTPTYVSTQPTVVHVPVATPFINPIPIVTPSTTSYGYRTTTIPRTSTSSYTPSFSSTSTATGFATTKRR
jgi:hypothetical protein